ncbi:MAG: hypothetical protein ACREI9_08460 [Nitrospiraceae bacterium]
MKKIKAKSVKGSVPSAMAAQKMWKNRIVAHAEVDPAILNANPKNFRIHPAYQKKALGGVLSDIGWIQDVIVNKRSGLVVDGHLRVALAMEQGQKKVPVKYVDLNPREERMALMTLDPIGALAETDAAKARALADEVIGDAETTGAVREMVRNFRDSIKDGKKDKDQNNDKAVMLDQAIQLKPQRDYVVVMCDDDGGDDFERLRQVFGLKEVRRGGYEPGNQFDDIGIERVVAAKTLFKVIEQGYLGKGVK